MRKGELFMGKKPQISAATRQKLQDAFWQLYQEKGIENISVKEITDLAGYNRGTFYLYYKDTYDMLNQIERQILPDIPRYPDNAPAGEYIWKAAQSYFRHREYLTVLLGPHGDPVFREKIRQGLLQFLECHLTQFQDEPDPVKRDLMLEFCASGSLSLIIAWLNCQPALPVEDLIRLFIRLLTPYCTKEMIDIMKWGCGEKWQ
jgi:AcrR family transcriptional regulator